MHCFDIWHGMGLNFGEPKLNFLFVKISFGMKMKGHRNPSWPRSSERIGGCSGAQGKSVLEVSLRGGGDIGAQGKTHNSKFKQTNSKLGELYALIFILRMNCMIYVYDNYP